MNVFTIYYVKALYAIIKQGVFGILFKRGKLRTR